MSNRLDSREIPLFWSREELGPLRTHIESWYSAGVPINTIIKRCVSPRTIHGKRPLIYPDVYAVLQDAVRRGTLVQRTNAGAYSEMPIATFKTFFKTFREGGSQKECYESVLKPKPPENSTEKPCPAYADKDVCDRIFRSMSERWRSEQRGATQALINKPVKQKLAARPNLELNVPAEIAQKLAQKIFDLVLEELELAIQAGKPKAQPTATSDFSDEDVSPKSVFVNSSPGPIAVVRESLAVNHDTASDMPDEPEESPETTQDETAESIGDLSLDSLADEDEVIDERKQVKTEIYNREQERLNQIEAERKKYIASASPDPFS